MYKNSKVPSLTVSSMDKFQQNRVSQFARTNTDVSQYHVTEPFIQETALITCAITLLHHTQSTTANLVLSSMHTNTIRQVSTLHI